LPEAVVHSIAGVYSRLDGTGKAGFNFSVIMDGAKLGQVKLQLSNL
jgi:hypothetical protein